MEYKEGDKVFVPFELGSELGYWHTLTKKEADARNHMAKALDRWAKELEKLTNGDK